MKKLVNYLLFILQVTGTAFAFAPAYQPPTPTALSQKNDLALLGRIWGLLKYHHPAVIKGTYNWDEELLKLLPSYSSSKNNTERDQLLLKWIKGLGDVQASEPVPDSLLTNTKLKPDYTWISKSKLSEKLSSLLTQISNCHIKGDQHYLKFLAEDDIALPNFVNENAYASMSYPATEYRLLAVYRYWNIIEYWYPYKHLTQQKWADYLQPFITEAIAAKDETAYIRFIQKMVGTIHDSHAVVSSQKIWKLQGKWVMPFTVRFIEGKAVINWINTKEASSADLEVGNIVKAIDDVSVNKIVALKKPYISASNQAVVLREATWLLNRSQDSISRVIIISNDNKKRVYTLKNSRNYPSTFTPAYDFAYQKDSSCFMLPRQVIYVNAGTFKASQVDWIKQQLQTSKGLVLDARQYPRGGAGNLSVLLDKLLLADKGAMAKFSSVVPGYPGLFHFAKPFIIGHTNPNFYKGKVAILVNEETQSTAEFITMAYQLAPKAIVVGSTTAGADGNVCYTFPLPGGLMTQITGLGVYYPDGKETQQTGIVPNVKASQTIAGYRKHEDDLLNKAVEVICQP